MFAKIFPPKLSKKIASSIAGIFFIFMNMVVPANAAVYPGDPGAGVNPGAYGSYNYSFCYYNNNDDLECFDSINPQLGIVKEISDPAKLRVVAPNATTVPYRLTITNNSSTGQNINTFYLRDYLPDSILSISAPTATPGSLALSNNNTDMTWTGTMTPGQSVVIEFVATTRADLTPYLNQYQTNTACVSTQELVEGNTSVSCNQATFEVVPAQSTQLDLLLNKTINGSNSFRQGDQITYRFTVTNVGGVNVSAFDINENGAVDSRSVWPSDYLNNITAVSVVSGGGQATVNNNVITWNGNTIAPGESVTITATTTVRQNIAAPGQNITATNRACVRATNDVNPANDCATFNTIISVPPVTNPQLGIEKQISDNTKRSILVSEAGTTVPYQVTITNTTNPAQTISEFFVIDVLPPALTGNISNVRVISGGGAVTQVASSPDMRWTGSLAFGAQVVIGFDATLQSNLANFANTTQQNTACVRLTQTGRNEGCHYDQFVIVPDTIPGELDLELFKGELNGDTGFTQGETITYEFIVTNNSSVSTGTFSINESAWPTQYIENITSVTTSTGSIMVNSTNNLITWTAAQGQTNPLATYGGTVTITATATVKTGLNLTENASAQNRACVEAAGDPSTGPRGANNCHDFSVNITPGDAVDETGIGIQKEVVGPNVAYKGQTTTMRYRLLISNNGAQPITPTQAAPIIITEELPAAVSTPLTNVTTSTGTASLQTDGTTIHWYGATIPAGSQISIDFTAPLGNLSAVADESIQQNVATATYDGDEDEDDAEFTVEDAPEPGTDLHLEKTADRIIVGVGDTVNYRFTLTNTKSTPFSGTVTIDESQWPSAFVSNIQTVSAGATLSGNTITWTGSIAAGQSVDVTATATATAVGAATNIAVITTPNDDNPNNNTDQTTVTIIADVPEDRGIAIQKIVIGDSSIIRGTDTSVEYEITVGNATTENITSFTIVEEQWPAVFSSITGVTVTRGTATLAANGRDINWTGSATDFTPLSNLEFRFTGVLRNNLTASDDGVQRNLASVTYRGITNKDDAEFTINQPGGNPEMDLGIQKEVASEDIIVAPGETVNYTFTITNNSSREFDGSFRIAEQWPTQYLNDINSINAEFGTATRQGNDIIWTGKIASGAQLKILVTAIAKNVEGRATNIATIRNPDGTPWVDAVPGNDSDQTTVTIIRGPGGDPIDNVEKILNGNLQSVAPGAQVTFTARFTNTSEQTVSRVTIREVETNFTINTITANTGTITGNSPTYTWTGTLTPGQPLVVTITGTVANAVGQTMKNRITFEDARDPNNNPIVDPDPEDNTDETTPIPIEADPIDNVTKTVDGNPGSVVTGQKINFTSTVTNRSGRTITRYTITEQVQNFRIDTITATSGTISGSGPTYTWTGSLANGQTLTVRISGTVTGAAGNNVVNTITFSDARDQQNSPITDPDPRDNTAQTPPVPIRAPADDTPITGGAIAVTAGVLGVASIAGAGYYFWKKRGGFKLNQ